MSVAAVFTAVNATLLRPVPIPEGDRLVRVSAARHDGVLDRRLARRCAWARRAVGSGGAQCLRTVLVVAQTALGIVLVRAGAMVVPSE